MRTDMDISLYRLAQRPEPSPARGAGGLKGKDAADAGNLRLKQAAREFESLLLEQMVKEMRDATPKSDLFGEEKGRELFQEMLDGEFVRVMSDSGGIGLADFLVRSLADKGITR